MALHVDGNQKKKLCGNITAVRGTRFRHQQSVYLHTRYMGQDKKEKIKILF